MDFSHSKRIFLSQMVPIALVQDDDIQLSCAQRLRTFTPARKISYSQDKCAATGSVSQSGFTLPGPLPNPRLHLLHKVAIFGLPVPRKPSGIVWSKCSSEGGLGADYFSIVAVAGI